MKNLTIRARFLIKAKRIASTNALLRTTITSQNNNDKSTYKIKGEHEYEK